MAESSGLLEFIELVVEARRMREAEVSGGGRVPHGSKEHVRDLKTRIADMTRWRDSQKKGSEQRANYSRIVSRLKAELRSVTKNAAAKPSSRTKRRSVEPVLVNAD